MPKTVWYLFYTKISGFTCHDLDEMLDLIGVGVHVSGVEDLVHRGRGRRVGGVCVHLVGGAICHHVTSALTDCLLAR